MEQKTVVMAVMHVVVQQAADKLIRQGREEELLPLYPILNMYKGVIMSAEGEKLKIVVIDSGFTPHIDIDKIFNGISLCYDKDKIILTDSIQDNIGHGTAITFLINKYVSYTDIFCIKIYDDEYCKPNLLLYALNYIDTNMDCDIINISLGTTSYSDLGLLQECCQRLSQKGVIIVSAFDNNGTISYPAAFDSVIGVDAGYKTGNIMDFDYIENSPINIMGYYHEQRLPWINNRYETVSGASFIAPYTTIHIAQIMGEGFSSLEEIKNQLKKRSKKVTSFDNHISSQAFLPNKAIVFPFNKEIHSLARYIDQLKFEITDFYDIKYVGNIGKTTSQVIGGICHSEHRIKNYSEIDWNSDFDTLIIGHTSELSDVTKIDLKRKFLDKALIHKKNVFSFDGIGESYLKLFLEKGLKIYFPNVTKNHLPHNQFGKLRKVGKPIVAVVGTGPRQGKLTLQMSIKTILESSGYNVGMLGTEPSALLLGANEVYPMGYNSTVNVSGYQAIKVVNYLLGKIEDKNPELIIIGSQSQSAPFTDSSLKYLPVAQHEFILGTAPDCFILCININDDLLYIKRTISYLESLFGSKVLALAALPLEHAQKWSVISNKKTPIAKEVLEKRLAEIKEASNLEVFDISDEKNVMLITENIINFFSNN